VTASVLHGTKLGMDGQWSSTLVWGANARAGQSLSHSVLGETEAILDSHNTVLARAEFVQKSAEDLAVDPSLGFPSDFRMNVASASLGFIRELARWQGTTIGLGAVATVNVVPLELERTYGSRTPVGGLLFLRLRPFHTHGDGK
jgi:hypothetical protein